LASLLSDLNQSASSQVASFHRPGMWIAFQFGFQLFLNLIYFWISLWPTNLSAPSVFQSM
jgi:hypothetical protein